MGTTTHDPGGYGTNARQCGPTGPVVPRLLYKGCAPRHRIQIEYNVPSNGRSGGVGDRMGITPSNHMGIINAVSFGQCDVAIKGLPPSLLHFDGPMCIRLLSKPTTVAIRTRANPWPGGEGVVTIARAECVSGIECRPLPAMAFYNDKKRVQRVCELLKKPEVNRRLEM